MDVQIPKLVQVPLQRPIALDLKRSVKLSGTIHAGYRAFGGRPEIHGELADLSQNGMDHRFHKLSTGCGSEVVVKI